ncbi:MAG: 2-hydroxy-3-oxopropionate reductase GlxR, partial [Glaciihabitans sp.]|nr:2-hydroxy-3-oxopropionate reductase GlxR [Glaciihabitans sp.]
MSESLPTVAVLGTGALGAAMIDRLADSGFPLTIWNRTLETAQAVANGRETIVVAAEAADAAAGADI